MSSPKKIKAIATSCLVSPVGVSLFGNGIRKQRSGELVEGSRRKPKNFFYKEDSHSGQRLPNFHPNFQRAQNGREGSPLCWLTEGRSAVHPGLCAPGSSSLSLSSLHRWREAEQPAPDPCAVSTSSGQGTGPALSLSSPEKPDLTGNLQFHGF